MKIFIEKEYSIGGKFVVCDTQETFALLANTVKTYDLTDAQDSSSSFIYSDCERFHPQWDQVFGMLTLMGVEIIQVSCGGTSFPQSIRNLGYSFYGENYW